MIQSNDNPGQGNRAGQEPGGGAFHKSRNDRDDQSPRAIPDEKEQKKDEEEKFSPGEDENYDAEDFSTD